MYLLKLNLVKLRVMLVWQSVLYVLMASVAYTLSKNLWLALSLFSFGFVLQLFAMDEKNNIYALLVSLPIRRYQIVLVNYLTLFLEIVYLFIISIVSAVIIRWLEPIGLTFPQTLLQFTDLTIFFIAMGLVIAFYVPAFYWKGTLKGLFISGIVFSGFIWLLSGVFYLIMKTAGNWPGISQCQGGWIFYPLYVFGKMAAFIGLQGMIGLMLFITLLVLAVSVCLSIRLFKRNEL
jgi:hypothetical protein